MNATHRLFEEPGSEIVQTSAPRQPFVSRTRRLEINVRDTGLGQLLAEVLGAGALHRADPQEEDFDLLIERGSIREHTVIGRLRVECAPTAARAAAEAADVGELIEVRQGGQER